MRKPWPILIVMAFVALGAIAAEQLQCIRANDQGEIVLDRQATVGDATLAAGVYLVHSEVVDGKHYIHFVEESKKYEVHAAEWFEQAPLTGIGEAKCGTEQLTKKASATAIYFAEEPTGVRIKKIEIRGEDHAHIF